MEQVDRRRLRPAVNVRPPADMVTQCDVVVRATGLYCGNYATVVVSGRPLCGLHSRRLMAGNGALGDESERYIDWFRAHYRGHWQGISRKARQGRHGELVKALRDPELPESCYLRWQLIGELRALDDLAINAAAPAPEPLEMAVQS